MQQDLNDLVYFVHVVEHQGFSPASRELGVPKSKLSRRIALLEERLGVRLLQRSTRHFSVTDIGQSYYTHCKAMLVEAEAAQEVVDRTRAEPRGIVRIACPIALLHTRVGPMLADFMAENPLVTIHLEATNRHIDVVAEGIDVAIRVRVPPLKDSDLVVRVLSTRRWCVAASPLLLQRIAVPQSPADLSGLPTLDWGSPMPQHVWHLAGPNGAMATIHHTPRLITDDMISLRTAAVAGVGIVQLPTMMITDELKQGTLAILMPEWSPKGGTIHAVMPSRRGLLPSVRALIDFLAARFAKLDEP
ncbi:LysR family transcriptional regulator [Massilia cavernae]|uniref:LysR family transcriptional regulator n=1 Tax=Massilia cavernae TaxID=2320864 RepID=A0A418X6Y1_9BURK|nr:LysR family transcriptional regulator [Massilia cavernae]RJG08254.1 LysR family transcriptional regulator [Massilia cavernae]